MNGKQLRKIFEEYEWRCERIRGSHHIMVKKGRRSIPIPIHAAEDIPRSLVRNILKQAGIP